MELAATEEDVDEVIVVIAAQNAHVTDALLNLPWYRVDLLQEADEIDDNGTYNWLV